MSWTLLSRIKRALGLGGSQASLPERSLSPPSPPVSGENLLLMSDLHLGEACKDFARIEYLKRASALDEAFCRFLEHHTQKRLEGRPWRLVLGGDLFDFLQVTLAPAGATATQRRYGLGTAEAESAWKMARLVDRHRAVFVYLADFIGAGNRVEIVQGNHDQELFWPEVQKTLVSSLVQLYFGGELAEGDPDDFAARVRFHGWFYCQPELIYVEHGHRFDPACVTPPQLCPLRPQQEEELVVPLSGLAIRYFANLERGFKTHDKEHWGIADYLAYYRAQGPKAVLEVMSRYVRLMGRVVSHHLEHARFVSARAQGEHEQRRGALAVALGVSDETLAALDRASAPSVMASRFGLYAALGLAEWSAVLAFLGCLGLVVVTPFGAIVDGLLLLATGLGGALWARSVRRRFAPQVRNKLLDEAGAISRALQVPVVVMGHTHGPLRQRLTHDHRCFYLNTGCFLAHERPSHGPDERCNCTMTFATLLWPEYGRPKPELHRWCGVRHRPEPMGPTD